MNKNLSDITVVMDRSGSMGGCQQEAENGLNHLVDDQKKQDGECNFTLVQFDNEYDVVHDGVPISEVPELKLVPRGMTALNDAVGKAINTVGERLGKMDDNDRPALVTMVIITDGGENASHEFTSKVIKEMITTQEEKYAWKFIFLGANQDAFAEGGKIGVAPANAANYSVQNTNRAFDMISTKMSGMRSASMCGQQVSVDYTQEERESIA